MSFVSACEQHIYGSCLKQVGSEITNSTTMDLKED